MADAKFGRNAVAQGRCVNCLALCQAYVCEDCCFPWSREDDRAIGATPTKQGKNQRYATERLVRRIEMKRDVSPYRHLVTLSYQREVVVSDCLDCPWVRDVEDAKGKNDYICSESGKRLEEAPWLGPPDWCPLRQGNQLITFRYKSKDL